MEFPVPNTLMQSGQTNKQQQSSFNNIDLRMEVSFYTLSI